LEKIDQQNMSGKSIAAWCKDQGISYNTFLFQKAKWKGE
jgi:hypothetical protein